MDISKVGTMPSGSMIDDCPFKGPEPFAEFDAPRFFGRDEQLRMLLDMIRRQRLTVLTAESGAGKTSLIHAGLIPALRLLRENLHSNRPGPAICIQGRGPRRDESAAPLLAHRIHSEIVRLARDCAAGAPPLLGVDTLRMDLAALREIPAPAVPVAALDPGSVEERDWLLGYLRALCDAVSDGSLFLVIDQLEELMGSGATSYSRDQSARTLELIATTFMREERLQLLLSIREDYAGRLRPLDDLVGALIRRTCHIAPLSMAAFRDSILLTVEDASPVRGPRTHVTPDAVERVLDWTAGVGGADRRGPVDALVAMAILKDVYLDRRHAHPDGPVVIDLQTLDAYQNTLKDSSSGDACLHDSTPVGVAENAMFRHIDRALGVQPASVDDERLTDDQIKRMAARMGAALSSPRGFKRHVTDVQLVLEALREDLGAPPMGAVSRKALRNRISQLRNRTPCVRSNGSLNPASATPSEKADFLAGAALAAIDRLVAGNVLKHHGTDEHQNRIVALQHDGFGPAFDLWGEQRRSHVDDALATVVGCYGKVIRGEDSLQEQREIDSLAWVGCRLESLTFHNVTFRKCDFSGSWMWKCVFSNCEFIDCRLGALGLEECTMSDTVLRGKDCDLRSLLVLGGTWRDVHVIGHCDASGLLVRNSSWTGGVEFVDTTLTSAIMDTVHVEGRLRFQDCTLRFAQIFPFAGPGADRTQIHGCRLHGALIGDYHRLSDAQTQGNVEICNYEIARLPPR